MAQAADRTTNTIHVTNISYQTNGRGLAAGFQTFGPIESIRIMTAFNSRGQEYSRGFGFVQFRNAADYQKALDSKDPISVEGRELRISPAKPPERKKRDTAFVGLIPAGTTQEQIQAAFAAYNPVRVRLIAREGRRPFAFVRFATEDDQTRAVGESREKLLINGEKVVVRFARPRGSLPRRDGPRAPRARAPRAAAPGPRQGQGARPRGGRRSGEARGSARAASE
jgi:RNA recognition motif-containing protein